MLSLERILHDKQYPCPFNEDHLDELLLREHILVYFGSDHYSTTTCYHLLEHCLCMLTSGSVVVIEARATTIIAWWCTKTDSMTAAMNTCNLQPQVKVLVTLDCLHLESGAYDIRTGTVLLLPVEQYMVRYKYKVCSRFYGYDVPIPDLPTLTSVRYKISDVWPFISSMNCIIHTTYSPHRLDCHE